MLGIFLETGLGIPLTVVDGYTRHSVVVRLTAVLYLLLVCGCIVVIVGEGERITSTFLSSASLPVLFALPWCLFLLIALSKVSLLQKFLRIGGF